MTEINKLEQDKDKIFQIFLESENNPTTLIDTAKKLLDKAESDPLYSILICEKIHKIYKEKTILNSKIKSIIDEETKWRSTVQNQLTNKFHDYKKEISIIEKNKEFLNFLPNVKSEETDFQDKMLDASLLMAKSGYAIYSESNLKLRSIKQKQQMKQQQVEGGMEIDTETNDSNDTDTSAVDFKSLESQYLESFNKVLDQSIQDLSPKNSIEISKFLQKNGLPMICVRISKALAIKINNERKLKRETSQRSDYLDVIMYQLIEACVGSIFDTISTLENKATHLITEKELQDLVILKNGELLKEFIEFILPEYLQDPEGIIKIGNSLLNINQYNHVVLVAERGRLRLDNLKNEQTAKESLEHKIKTVTNEIKSIEKVQGSADELRAQLLSLDQQYSIYKILPAYYSMDKKEFSRFNLEIATLRIKSILEMKESSKGKLDIQSHLDDTLKTLLDPSHIYQLANLLQKTECDTALIYGERCQRFITDLEILRQVRLPLTNLINQLEKEETALRLDGRTLSDEKREQLDATKSKISTLPEFPFFSDLNNRNEYDRLNLYVAQMMITCVLEKKAKLSNSKDQSLRNKLNQQVSALINMCLEKFKDPKYLLELEKHLTTSREDKVLVQITNQIFNRCTEIEKQRVVRVALGRREKESFDDAEKLSLQLQIEQLELFPYYTSLHQENQYDDTIYQSANTLLNYLLDGITFIDEKLRKAKLFNIKNIEDEELLKEKEELNQLLNQSLVQCLKYIKSPSLVCKLANSLGPKRESIHLDISKHIHPILVSQHQEAMKFKKDQFIVSTLNSELQELIKMKKEMSSEDIQLLEDTNNRIKSIVFPYVDEWVEYYKYNSKLIMDGITLLHKNKQDLVSNSTTTTSKTELANSIKLNQDNIKEQFTLLGQYLDDPNSFISILTGLKSKNEFDLVLELGKLAFTKLQIFRQHQINEKSISEKKKQLTALEEQLNKQRRRLPTEKHIELREIVINEKLNQLKAPYYNENLDKLSLAFGDVLIESNTEERQEFEKKATSKAFESQFKYIADQRKRINDNISSTISLVVENIESLETLLTFANNLFLKKEYLLVLQVGKIIEQTLELKKNVIEQKETLLKESKELQARFLRSGSTEERSTIQPLIDQNQIDYDAIVPTHTYDQIKTLTLSITNIMIQSANFEDLGEILREQVIISFKITTNVEEWDRIRNLSSEEEWEETKKELVSFIMKREENVNSKIELLLKDLLLEEAIQIFPNPDSESDHELDIQLNLLVSLYDAIDEHAFHLINNVLPIVQRFAKRCYLSYKAEKLDILYESVQKREPTFIKDIFQTSLDMMLVNILPSQYPQLLNTLKSFKRRMVETLGLPDLWEKFLEHFKKTHKTKKRLIQMISFIGDSVWQINPTNASSKSKRTSQTQASPVIHKKIKVASLQQTTLVDNGIGSVQLSPTLFNPNNNNNFGGGGFTNQLPSLSFQNNKTPQKKKMPPRKAKADDDDESDEEENCEEEFYNDNANDDQEMDEEIDPTDEEDN